jgi:hypothetical protein
MIIYKDVILGILISIILLIFYQNINKKCDNINKAIKILVRQAARWSTAATQDSNSMIAVLHANYGVGYLEALKDIATDKQIKDAAGIDIKKFRDEIVKVQDYATMKMAKLCPNYAPKRTYLTSLGGEGNKKN